MLGKNHIISNVCCLLIGSTGLIMAAEYTGEHSDFINEAAIIIIDFICPQGITPIGLFFGILLFLLGTLLPDIDSDSSFLGRYICVPVEHRTWTHAIWIPLIIFIISLFERIFIYASIGFMLHLIFDNLSYGGVCFLYPFSKYRHYGSGAKVKRKHTLKLYRVGKTSEYVFTAIIITITVIWLGYFLFNFVGILSLFQSLITLLTESFSSSY